MPQNRNQRDAAVHRDIAEIDPEQDVHVRVLGTILEVREDSLVIDDGTGTTEVFADADDIERVEDGQRIRVLGRVLPAPDSFEIQGEYIQDMSSVDMDQYQQVKEIVGDRMP